MCTPRHRVQGHRFQPLGVEICAPELDGVECTFTDENGTWTLTGIPKDSDFFLTSSHEDYVPSLFPQHSSMDWYDWYKVAIPTSVMSSNANRLDIDLEDDKGQLPLVVLQIDVQSVGIAGHDRCRDGDFVPVIPVHRTVLRKKGGHIVFMAGGEKEITVFWNTSQCPGSILVSECALHAIEFRGTDFNP